MTTTRTLVALALAVSGAAACGGSSSPTSPSTLASAATASFAGNYTITITPAPQCRLPFTTLTIPVLVTDEDTAYYRSVIAYPPDGSGTTELRFITTDGKTDIVGNLFLHNHPLPTGNTVDANTTMSGHIATQSNRATLTATFDGEIEVSEHRDVLATCTAVHTLTMLPR